MRIARFLMYKICSGLLISSHESRPVALSCRPKRSFKPPSVRKRRDFHPLCSTSRRSCGTHSDRIQASTQWYLQSDALSLANRKLSCAVSIGVDPVYGRPCVARRPELHARAQCTDGDVRGLVVFPLWSR
jgi:hypothetical protein